jgi:hypothetical protein
MGYSGTHGAEDKKRQAMLSKPQYFQKNFNKSSKQRSEIPHLETKATPKQLQELKQRLKKGKIKKVALSIITWVLTVVVLYFIYQWMAW